VARFAMGLVIFSGISIGTLFTLFVVPTFYLLIAKDYSRMRARPAFGRFNRSRRDSLRATAGR
jgi:hypothetical protein